MSRLLLAIALLALFAGSALAGGKIQKNIKITVLSKVATSIPGYFNTKFTVVNIQRPDIVCSVDYYGATIDPDDNDTKRREKMACNGGRDNESVDNDHGDRDHGEDEE
jgi:hypothetical protein